MFINYYFKGYTDLVSHCKLFKAFLEMGFPKHLVAPLKSLYVKQRAITRWNGQRTQAFEIGRGARQGYIISPHLFVTYTEKGMRDAEVPKYGIKFGGNKYCRLALCRWHCSNSKLRIRVNFRTYRNSVNEIGKGVNLRLFVKKTKLLVAGADPDEVHNIEIDGETVEQVEVDHFKYLGSTKYNNACQLFKGH